jgi:hypothetical protein
MDIVNAGLVLSKRYGGQQKLDTCNKQVYFDLQAYVIIQQFISI